MSLALGSLYGQISQAAVNRSEGMLDRFMGLDENWETPWGKGPYWSEALMNRRIQGTVSDAKAAGIHPLYALGQAPLPVPGVVPPQPVNAKHPLEASLAAEVGPKRASA